MTSAAYIMVRRPRAVWDRPASDSRLLPTPFPYPVSFNKPPSGDGRSIDSSRQTLLQSNLCRDYAPLTGRVVLAGLPGEPQHPAIGGTRAIAPSHDSSVVTIGVLRFNHDGLESMLPFLKVVERYCWTGLPHTVIFSTFLHILKKVWGRRRVVADVEHPLRRTTGIGAGVAASLRKSPRPSIAFHSLIPDFYLPHPRPYLRHFRVVGLQAERPPRKDAPWRESRGRGVWGPPASTPVAAALVGALPADHALSPTPAFRDSTSPSKPFSPRNINDHGKGRPQEIFLKQSKFVPGPAHQSNPPQVQSNPMNCQSKKAIPQSQSTPVLKDYTP